MYRAGYTNIVNIDIADEVISKMKEYHDGEQAPMQCRRDSLRDGDGCHAADLRRRLF